MSAAQACGSMEFAHARLRARWGMRPDETTWHRIEITRELAPMLELARGSALAHWVHDLTPQAGLHMIEGALRRRWRDQVDEVAAWMDAAWQPAIRFCATLADLPLLAAWARGESMPGWVADDPGWSGLLADASLADEAMPSGGAPGARRHAGASRRQPAPREPARAALLEAARARPDELLAPWRLIWQGLLPAGRAARVLQRELLPLLQAQARSFASPATLDGWAARRLLDARLVALMRRHAAEPIEAFAYLALQALEFERLRAELVGRVAFPKRTWHA
jgi:hypothetical protein